MEVTETEAGYSVFYEYRNNGRGPTINETIALDEAGIPTAWTAAGNTTFGNAVDERYELSGDQASPCGAKRQRPLANKNRGSWLTPRPSGPNWGPDQPDT